MTVVDLDLTHHCIETAARAAHRAARDALIRGDDDEAGERLQLLAAFLEATDFAALRARDPRLAGGHPTTVRLARTAAGVTWSFL